MANTLKVALVGSRGISAKYGGNEAITEEIAQRLTEMGWKVYVTCESKKFYIDDYNGVIRVHTLIWPYEWDKEHKVLNEFGLSLDDYYLTVARIVAENNIHWEIESFKKSS